MTGKDLEQETNKKTEKPSVDDGMTRTRTEPHAFYVCKCPECVEDDLELIDTGGFWRSGVAGITGKGEIGCYRTGPAGEYELGLFCRRCGRQVCTDSEETESCNSAFLTEWARSNGERHSVLPFSCPVCDSEALYKIEVGIEFHTAVVAVCEADYPRTNPIQALSYVQDVFGGGSFRYHCSNGHELAKDDGSPVENPKELVEWLKAQRLSIKR
jgi:hypothetical protein